MSNRSASRLVLVFVSVCAAALGGCAASSPVHVSTEYDPQADLGAMKTFAWGPGADATGDAARQIKPEGSAAIRTEISRVLTEKGMREAAAGSADVLITFDAAVNSRSENVSWPKTAGGKDVAGRATQQTWVYSYDMGTLVVHLTDRASGRPMWRGTAQAELKQDSRAEVVRQAVEKLFAGFPPPKRA